MFYYLLCTLLIEIPVVVIAYRNEWKTALPAGILLNLFTWPVLTLLMYFTSIHLLILETCVFAVEATGFKIFLTGSWRKALLVSFIANALSLTAGFISGGYSIQL